MYSFIKWKHSKYSKMRDEKFVEKVTLDRNFWQTITTCLKAAYPLIKVLRLVDSDENPTMPFIYEKMDCCKEKIQENFKNVKKAMSLFGKLSMIDGHRNSIDHYMQQHIFLILIFILIQILKIITRLIWRLKGVYIIAWKGRSNSQTNEELINLESEDDIEDEFVEDDKEDELEKYDLLEISFVDDENDEENQNIETEENDDMEDDF
ncbi:hypothetical protein SLE2022_374630 [Rubroshorea leprosula]